MAGGAVGAAEAATADEDSIAEGVASLATRYVRTGSSLQPMSIKAETADSPPTHLFVPNNGMSCIVTKVACDLFHKQVRIAEKFKAASITGGLKNDFRMGHPLH